MDPWLDPGTEDVRAAHLAPLVGWIRDHWASGGPVRLLDYGCGDMLLGRLLGERWVVDGYDLDPAARAAARPRGRGVVHDDPEQIPLGAYDGVVISSVLQYLDGAGDIASLLRRVTDWLRPDDAFGVVATDVVVPGGARWADAWDLVRVLVPAVGARRAVRGLVDSARRSPGNLLVVGEDELLAAVAGVGVPGERLERNLSPFSRRATFLFRSSPTRPGGSPAHLPRPTVDPRSGDPAQEAE